MCDQNIPPETPDEPETAADPVVPEAVSAVHERRSKDGTSSVSIPSGLQQESPHSLRHASMLLRNARSSIASWRSSMSSLGNLLPRRSMAQVTYPYPPGLLNVVSIDDYESEESDSGPHSKLQPTRRRLPRRDDVAFVRRSVYSTSSGVNSALSEGTSDADDRRKGKRSLKMWHLRPVQRGFVESGPGRGDPEDALRKLEGQVDSRVIEENHQKVDNWLNWVDSREADPNADTGSVEDLHSESDEDEPASEMIQDGLGVPAGSEVTPDPVRSEDEPVEEATTNIDGLPEASSELEQKSGQESVGIETGAPSFVSSQPLPVATIVLPVSSNVPHHSFILDFTAQEIAEQMTVVDHEMFEKIQFHHLLSLDWARPDLLSKPWIEFIKERSRLEYEAGQYPERNIQKINDVAAVRVRAYSVTRFVSSEITQSLPSERSALFCKFIRVAWVSR